MKDQYFGDARDYFKYHLIEELIASLPEVKQLLCLWMLTPPDQTNEGNVPFVESQELPDLTSFLQGHLDSGDRRVRHMQDYVSLKGIDYTPWGDEAPYFSNAGRTAYFDTVPSECLRDAVVFFDPDKGISLGKVTPQHVAIDEVSAMRQRMSGNSVVVIYQHFPRKTDFWNIMAETLRERVGGVVGYVADPAVCYFVISGDMQTAQFVDPALHRVALAGPSRRMAASRGADTPVEEGKTLQSMAETP